VTTAAGEAVEDLRVEDFVVSDEGRPQPIQTFARGEFPLSVVLAVDRSFSMSGPPLRLAREAARTFLGALRSDDQALVVAIGREVEPFGTLSTDRPQQLAALDALVPWGTTSLHDAVIAVVERAAAGRGRRAVIVLSDGQDRYSRATADDVRARVRSSDVLCYGITLGPTPSPLFRDLAALTGGRAFHVETPQQLPGVFTTVSRELRTQYLLGYVQPEGASGWRRITVRVTRSDVQVRARSGYQAR
jgi:VWFA-related protein